MRYKLVAFLTFLLLIAVSASAQIADLKKDNSSINNPPARQGTLAEQASRGEIPLNFADERLQMNAQKIRRLPPTSLPAQSNKINTSDSFLIAESQ